MIKTFKKTTLIYKTSYVMRYHNVFISSFALKSACRYFSSFCGLNAEVENTKVLNSLARLAKCRCFVLSFKSDSLYTVRHASTYSRQRVYKSGLTELESFLKQDSSFINNDTQIVVEKFVHNHFKSLDENKPDTILVNINLSKITPKLKDILREAIKNSKIYMATLKKSCVDVPINKSYIELQKEKSKKGFLDILVSKILNEVDSKDIIPLIFTLYLRIISFVDIHTDDEDDIEYGIYSYSTNVFKTLGLQVTNLFYRELYFKYKSTVKDENNLKGYKDWFNSLDKETSFYHKNDALYVSLGSKLIEILSSVDLLYINVRYKGKEKNQSFVDIPDRIKVLLDKKTIYSTPPKLPMIVPPKPYSEKSNGGYLLNDDYYNEDLIIEKWSFSKQSQIKTTNVIYSMVNQISSTGYRINIPLLEFLELKGEKYNILIPDDFDKDFNSLEKKTKYYINKHKAKISKLTIQENILAIANLFMQRTIYFPIRLDLRGRIYCQPSYFNYQSTDLAKSLLLFDRAGIIKRNDDKGINFLKVFGANCYGNGLDKLNYIKRMQWVDDNTEKILSFRDGKILSKCKNKELFLSFCFEYERYINFLSDESQIEFKNYLPIQLDATCNGFQHLALLSNESKLFVQLNISKQTTDKGILLENKGPGDLYSYMVIKLTEVFEARLIKGTEKKTGELESIKRLSLFLWNRDILKKVLMTIPYNIRLKTVAKYIKEKLTEIEPTSKTKTVNDKTVTVKLSWYVFENNPQEINYDDLILLSTLIVEIISTEFTKITKLIEYLKNVAKICGMLNIPIFWSLPHGLEISQSYQKLTTERIPVSSFTTSVINLSQTVKGMMRVQKQTTALMPNLIHSLDATSMTLLYNEFSKIYSENTNLYTVHDCFATTSEKIETLMTILRSVYTKLYSKEPYLREFDRGIIETIKANYSTSLNWSDSERKLTFKGKEHFLIDIDWVVGKKLYDNKFLKRIDSDYIIT